MSSNGSNVRTNVILLVFFLLVNLLVYGETLGYSFMMEDDRLFNLWARPFDLNSVLACLNPFEKNLIYYRPTTNFLFLALNNLSSGDPLICRVYILLMFTVFSALVYGMTLGIFKDRLTAVLAAVLFSVHPINGFYVNYITASTILIWGVTMMAALYAHQLFVEKKRWLWFGLSVVCSVLALASHEMAGMLPVFVFVLNCFLGERFLKAVLRSLPYVFMVALWHLPRMIFFARGENVPGMMLEGISNMGLTPANYLPSMMSLIGWYFQKLVWPQNILFMKSIWPVKSNLLIGNIAAGAAFALTLVILIGTNVRNIRWILFWFIVGIAPLAAAVFISPAQGLTIEPHWFMIGSLGFFWAVAVFLRFIRTKINPVLWSVFAACVIVVLVAGTKINNDLWRTQKSYCTYWLSLEPKHQFPSFWMGLESVQEGDLQSAEVFFKQSLTGWYIDWESFVNLAAIALRQEKYKESVDWSRKALALNPSAAEAYNNIGAAALAQGDPDTARQYFEKALEFDPGFKQASENLELIDKKK